MSNLADVSEGIISAILTKVNVAGAPVTVTIAQKTEGPLTFWLNDKAEASAYPFLSVHLNTWPDFGGQSIKQIVEVAFRAEIFVMDKAVAGENPYSLVRRLACSVLDNLLYTGDLGLSYVNYINPITIEALPQELNDYLTWSGTNSAAAKIVIDVVCTYNPYET